MKIKLDENIGRRGLELLRAAGHDVSTVWNHGLHGVNDERLFEICSAEERIVFYLSADDTNSCPASKRNPSWAFPHIARPQCVFCRALPRDRQPVMGFASRPGKYSLLRWQCRMISLIT